MSLRNRRSPWGAVYPCYASYIYPSTSAHLPLPVHLDVKGRWRRGGQAEGRRVGGVAVTLLGARSLAAVLIVVFGEESDVAIQEAACWRSSAQHGECHRHRGKCLTATSQSSLGFHLLRFNLGLGLLMLLTSTLLYHNFLFVSFGQVNQI